MLTILELVLMTIGKGLVLRKMGENPWMAIIPFYSEYLMLRHCCDSRLLMALCGTGLGWMSVIGLGNLLPAAQVTQLCLYTIVYDLIMFAGLLLAVGFLVALTICCHKLAQYFNHGVGYTVGLLLLPFIFLIALGVSKDGYIEYVN